MSKFLRRGALFLIPVLLWGLLNFLIDPFNYFGNEVIDASAKANSSKLNSLMYNTFRFIQNPQRNIIMGDSRVNLIPRDLLKEKTGEDWELLKTNAITLNEIFDLFYLANEYTEIENVMIGVNFSMYNKFSYKDRVPGVKKMRENPLLYLYNKDVAEASFYTLMRVLNGYTIDTDPPVSRNEFWTWNVEVKTHHWYGKYEFPRTLHEEFIRFNDFICDNGINVTYVVVPHHIEFRQKVDEYNLLEEEQAFLDFLRSTCADVYNFDIDSPVTLDSSNFKDPIHYKKEVGLTMINEIFKDTITTSSIMEILD